MFLSALFCEVKGLEPLGKYFLVRFIQHFGIADPVSLGVKALAKQFGLSDRQVTKSLDELDACGVMDVSSTPEGKGRPKRHYRLTEDFHKKLNKASAQPDMEHATAVDSLLKHENRKAVQASEKSEKKMADLALMTDLRSKKQPDRLTVLNRLLLSVLLCRADRFGVVNDLGFATLCKLTGLNKEQLRYRVGRLIDQGLIRAYVPGATSPILARKMKSIYYLNLDHPELAGVGSATSILVCMNGAYKIDGVMHADSVCEEIYRPNEANRSPYQSSKFKQFVRYFESLKEPAFELLQVMVERYAACLLSRYWSDLLPGSINKRIVDLGLRELISLDFRPSTQPPESDGDGTTCSGEEQFIEVLDQLYHWAYNLALWIKEFLGQIPNVPFDCMDFVIIPQPMKFGYVRIALLALPRSLAGWSGCLVVASASAEGEVERHYPIESDIPLEHRYNYGLLTRPGNDKVIK